MHHPGPPRFVAVGDEVELAPRDPDPSATYTWTLAAAPSDSHVSLGHDPVEHLVPDAPGRYLVRLDAPDGSHEVTVRAFPGDRDPQAEAASESHWSDGSGRSGGQRSGSGMDEGNVSGSGDETGSARGADQGSGEGGRPRLSLTASVEDDELLVRGETQPYPEGPETSADLDVEFLLDDRDQVDRDEVQFGRQELTVPVDSFGDRLRVHAVAVGEHGYSVPDAVDVARREEGAESGSPTDSDYDVSYPYHPPAWAEDSVIYEIYVRTFPGQDHSVIDAREGSVLDAIRERLDYIADLGVDAIWLTPVLENDHAPHGYNITDFFAIAEDLGTRADYERLIDEAHERDLRVLFDLVCNHSARAHPHFQAALSDPDSEYREWYEWRGATEPETYFEWEYIANFDFTHLPVRRHLLDAVDTWAPLVDGFRCDMAWAVPNGFWRELHDRLKARDSEFLLLDETIPYIADFQGGCFDVHFDSTTYAALRRVGEGEPADAVLDAIDERARAGFPDHAGFMLYAENHDETRYLVECGRSAAEAALGALFTLPGAPMVYAGQEFGQRGRRDDLAWGHTDETLRQLVESLVEARHELPALAAPAPLERVDYRVVDGPEDRVVAYRRVAEDGAGHEDSRGSEALAVVLNFGDDPVTVAVDGVTVEADSETENLVTGEAVGVDDELRVKSVAVVPADPSPD